MQNIAGVVILFNADQSVEENILSYLPYIQRLFVIDNSTDIYPFGESLANDPKVLFLHNGQNEGIAKRLNEALKLASGAGFRFLLTMDQDSLFDKKNIVRYLELIEGFNHDKIVQFGVTHQPTQLSDKNYSVNQLLITSGSVLDVDLAKQVGFFDEHLFIDEVDLEYCLRIISKGLQTVLFHDVYLEHRLGISTKILSGRKAAYRTTHSPFRMYYIIRNYLYIRKKYAKKFPAVFKKRDREILNSIKNNLLYNPDRLRVWRYLWKGINDYKNHKMGKLN